MVLWPWCDAGVWPCVMQGRDPGVIQVCDPGVMQGCDPGVMQGEVLHWCYVGNINNAELVRLRPLSNK